MTRLVPLLLLAAASCGPRAATVVDDRETYINALARSYCSEKDACGDIGSDDQAFESVEDCRDTAESFLRDWWTEEACGDGAIEAAPYLDCEDTIVDGACDGGLGDLVSAAFECNSGEVCTQ